MAKAITIMTNRFGVPPPSQEVRMDIDDFGFSLVSEQELKANEALLKQKVVEQHKTITRTAAELTAKLNGLRDMVLPLLQNLAQDPDKEYIRWPDRAEKVKAFIEKINNFVDS